MKTKLATSVLLIGGVFFMWPSALAAYTPVSFGSIEDAGTHFEITDSKYLNISLDSSEEINLRMESVPEMVTMMIGPDSRTAFAVLTLGGFEPLTTYYKYQDDYHNLTTFTTNENGFYSYIQDLSEPHFVFVQPRANTKFIQDNATGGDCALIGNWDWSTKTCTLTTDVTETIQIDDDNITLDGNNHIITGSNTGSGVYASYRSGVTVRNLNIYNFSNAVFFHNASQSSIRSVVTSNNYLGVRLYPSSEILIENTTTNNGHIGIYIMLESSNVTLRGNSMSDNQINFYIRTFSYGGFGHDIDTTNTVEGRPVYYIENGDGEIFDGLGDVGMFYCIKCRNMTLKNFAVEVSGNETSILLWENNDLILENITVANSNIGIRFNSSDSTMSKSTIRNNFSGVVISGNNNIFYQNNFVESYFGHIAAAPNNIFNLAAPTGGNYWDDFDEITEGCIDAGADGFCDAPYVFYGGQDNLPWTTQDGWVEPVSIYDEATELVKLVVDGPYLGDGNTYGGKGFDWNRQMYVTPEEVKTTGYDYWNNAIKSVVLSTPGVDCSGLVEWSYNYAFDPQKDSFHSVITYPGGADSIYENNSKMVGESNLHRGDLLFFGSKINENVDATHVAMYTDNFDYHGNQFDVVEAASPAAGIIPSKKSVLIERSDFKALGLSAYRHVILSPLIAGQYQGESPIDLMVIDPDGYTITSTTTIKTGEEHLREVPNELYYTEQISGSDGRPNDIVYWPKQKIGDYTAKIFPEPGVSPIDTYSLKFIQGDQTIILADNVSISEIPSQGYGVAVDESGSATQFTPASIDIKPGSDPNSINCNNENSVIPVAVLSDDTFDAMIIDADTVRFGPNKARETHIDKKTGKVQCHVEDVDNDGDLDLVLHFRLVDTGIQCGDTEATLTGKTTDGTDIKGHDLIQTVGENSKEKQALISEISTLLASLYEALARMLGLL